MSCILTNLRGVAKASAPIYARHLTGLTSDFSGNGHAKGVSPRGKGVVALRDRSRGPFCYRPQSIQPQGFSTMVLRNTGQHIDPLNFGVIHQSAAIHSFYNNINYLDGINACAAGSLTTSHEDLYRTRKDTERPSYRAQEDILFLVET